MQYFLFTVNKRSWEEHFKTRIAAINDPGHNPSNRQAKAQRQSALCEIVGISKGDLLFFYLQQEKKIMGLYEATSEPFFETRSLIRGGFIDKRFPIRVAFRQIENFQASLDMDEVWNIKDRGYFWSIQQQRGDAIGRHACLCLAKQDGERLIRMFREKNPMTLSSVKVKQAEHSNRKLPFDYRDISGRLHYEAVLQAILIKDFKMGKHRDIFGGYDYFVPFFPTSSQREIDILLFEHNGDGVLWYEILELKADCFKEEELDKLMNYEDWLTNSLAGGNARMVHSVGIANSFNDDVKNYIKGRTGYGGKKIRLIKYSYNSKNHSVSLSEETPIL